MIPKNVAQEEEEIIDATTVLNAYNDFFLACKTLNKKYMKTYMATAKITHKEILNTYVDKMKPKC